MPARLRSRVRLRKPLYGAPRRPLRPLAGVLAGSAILSGLTTGPASLEKSITFGNRARPPSQSSCILGIEYHFYYKSVTVMKLGQKYPVEPLTRPEVEALLAACSKGATGTRNRALVGLLWRSGLRVSEALALKPSDVQERSVRVLHGKGDKSRTVGLDATAKALLDLWIAERKALGLKGPLFCTLKGQPVKTAYVRALFKRLAADAGIEKRVHPHGLRHTHAFELINEGISLNVISAQLGHSTPLTTHRYVNHLNPKVVIDLISARV